MVTSTVLTRWIEGRVMWRAAGVCRAELADRQLLSGLGPITIHHSSICHASLIYYNTMSSTSIDAALTYASMVRLELDYDLLVGITHRQSVAMTMY